MYAHNTEVSNPAKPAVATALPAGTPAATASVTARAVPATPTPVPAVKAKPAPAAKGIPSTCVCVFMYVRVCTCVPVFMFVRVCVCVTRLLFPLCPLRLSHHVVMDVTLCGCALCAAGAGATPAVPFVMPKPVDHTGAPVEMMVVSVLCGKMLWMGQRIDKKMERQKNVFDRGYDSVAGGPHPVVVKGARPTGGESNIHAVYRASQLYPEYVVTYQRLPESRRGGMAARGNTAASRAKAAAKLVEPVKQEPV